MSNITFFGDEVLTPVKPASDKAKNIMGQKGLTPAEQAVFALSQANKAIDKYLESGKSLENGLEQLKKEIPILLSQGRVDDKNFVELQIKVLKERIAAGNGASKNEFDIKTLIIPAAFIGALIMFV